MATLERTPVSRKNQELSLLENAEVGEILSAEGLAYISKRKERSAILKQTEPTQIGSAGGPGASPHEAKPART